MSSSVSHDTVTGASCIGLLAGGRGKLVAGHHSHTGTYALSFRVPG